MVGIKKLFIMIFSMGLMLGLFE